MSELEAIHIDSLLHFALGTMLAIQAYNKGSRWLWVAAFFCFSGIQHAVNMWVQSILQ